MRRYLCGIFGGHKYDPALTAAPYRNRCVFCGKPLLENNWGDWYALVLGRAALVAALIALAAAVLKNN